MPIGLTNASAIFIALIDEISKTLLNNCAITFLDNIPIYSKDEDTYLQDLRKVFNLIRTHKLFAKRSKCAFTQKSVAFLGNLISEDDLQVNQHKIDTIKSWPILKNLHKLRSFLGLASFYRRFVEKFSHIAGPLTLLLSKTNPYSWTSDQQAAFDKIKQALISAPALTLHAFHHHYKCLRHCSRRSTEPRPRQGRPSSGL